MEQCYLMPGQERCEKIKDANGVPKVSYSYRSLQGAFFHCVSRSVEEAQSRCEDWLVTQDRCYRNCPTATKGYFAKRAAAAARAEAALFLYVGEKQRSRQKRKVKIWQNCGPLFRVKIILDGGN